MSKFTITVREACQFSGLGKTSIYKLVRAGKLTPRKFGKRTLIVRSELESLLLALPISEAVMRRRRENGHGETGAAPLPPRRRSDSDDRS
jgi:excisionase family DNA binding protein